MSKQFYTLIKTHEKEVNKLQQHLRNTHRLRKKKPEEWQLAAKMFRDFSDISIQHFVDKLSELKTIDNPEVLEFVICFLELNPMYFRSGYLKEIMLTKIKRTTLNATDKERLQNVLIDVVNCRGTRELKYYCRLAIQIADKTLKEFLSNTINTKTGAIKSRANYMINYLP